MIRTIIIALSVLCASTSYVHAACEDGAKIYVTPNQLREIIDRVGYIEAHEQYSIFDIEQIQVGIQTKYGPTSVNIHPQFFIPFFMEDGRVTLFPNRHFVDHLRISMLDRSPWVGSQLRAIRSLAQNAEPATREVLSRSDHDERLETDYGIQLFIERDSGASNQIPPYGQTMLDILSQVGAHIHGELPNQETGYCLGQR